MSMATFSLMIEITPKVLVVGAGHAGASIAATAVEAGLETTVWSRRPLADLSPRFRAICQSTVYGASRVAIHRQIDWWEHPDLPNALEKVDWLVLADEPRDTNSTSQEQLLHIERAAHRYRQLEAAGFGRAGRAVVRVGSPAGEAPDPAFPGAKDLPYVRLKRALGEQAKRASERGVCVSTVAPAEIHSAFSSYQSDPYVLALSRFDSLPAVHDIPVSAVSDQSLGEAVLVAAAMAQPGSWYEVADGTLGPGRALQLMAATVGHSPLPPLVEWHPVGAHHLFEVLRSGVPADLDTLVEGTEGWEQELAALQSLRDSQQTIAAASLWWAGKEAQNRARRAAGAAWAAGLGSVARAVGQQLSAEVLGVLLALGNHRSSEAVDGLAQKLRAEQPTLAARLLPVSQTSAVQRAQRLTSAVERQAARSSM